MKKSIRPFQSGQEVVAVLDIGSSKVACFIAKTDMDGKLEIIGIGHQLAEGIKAGQITDMHQAERSISAAVSAAEKMAGVNIEKITVGLSGKGVVSQIVKLDTELGNREIQLSDILSMMQKAQDDVRQNEDILVHCLPLEYAVDDNQGIKDPRAMVGRKLEAVMHVVRVSKITAQNLAKCLAQCHLDIEGFVNNAYAAGLACLSDDDKKLGTLVLDMGAGQTSFAVFKNGEMIFTDSIPVGGMHVTNDIALGLETEITHAERIKTLYGNVVSSVRDEQELIDIPQKEGNREEVAHVQRAMLVKVIQPRIEEMLELVKRRLDNAGFGRMGGRLVVTGGASQLAGVRQFAGHIFGKRAVRGVPMELEGLAESTSGPSFAVVIGMLNYVLTQRRLEREGFSLVGKSGLKVMVIRLGQWLKENF